MTFLGTELVSSIFYFFTNSNRPLLSYFPAMFITTGALARLTRYLTENLKTTLI